MISLTKGFRLDIKWWVDILPTWDGVSLFLDEEWRSPADFEVDAPLMGHSCYFNGSYYSQAWSSQDSEASRRQKRESMPNLELLAIAYACVTFGAH